MLILEKDEKSGKVRLKVGDEDDLWYLYNIVKPGDRAGMKSFRREEEKGDRIRAQKQPKRRMYLVIDVEKLEFMEFSDRLRVLGTIIEGPQDHGQHHALLVEANQEFTVWKDSWGAMERKRLEEAVKQVVTQRAVFLAIEDDFAEIAALRQYGLQLLTSIQASIQGKMYYDKKAVETGKKDFFDEVLDELDHSMMPETPLIIVGPGFTREEFLTYGRTVRRHLLKKVTTEATGQGGLTGIREAMKRGLSGLMAEKSQVEKEVGLVEALLTEIATDGLASYGHREVARALEYGAVDKLLITDRVSREELGETLLGLARETSSACEIISTVHEAGSQLDALGGVGALLRFKVQGI